MSARESKLVEYLKRVTQELHSTEARLRDFEDQQREPIALVAMNCRFPGGVRSPEDLWNVLHEGKDVIAKFPEDRGWDLDSLRSPGRDVTHHDDTLQGGFLYDAADFDAAFFGISPIEALVIDPQQRLLLETTWELFERARMVPSTLQRSQTGVYIGVISNDYATRLSGIQGISCGGPIGLGSAGSTASGRIAYKFGFEGPAITVDTACSSSLVAVHLACQALRQGDCSLAIAGGVSVMATPATLIEVRALHGMSADGRCRAFSAQANGTGMAEGVGVVLLERLSEARRNGHPVLAVIRGSAVNQDGRSQGLTAPNGPSQERVILRALERARISPSDVSAVEAHGTGTVLGDPIEAQALFATYGLAHTCDNPLRLGSLKSNIGHTQAAAGVAGIIKMVLALQNRMLPKTLHADAPSSHVDWSSGSIRLLTEPMPLESNGRPTCVGVSSFGVSGTNAHLILEETASPGSDSLQSEGPTEVLSPDATQTLTIAADEAFPYLVSGLSEHALRAQAARLREYVETNRDLTLHELAHSLVTTRTHFPHRAVIVARDRLTLSSGLDAVARGQFAPSTVTGQRKPAARVAFVFPGQGSQWPQMARVLLESSEAFRTQAQACEKAFLPYLSWSPLNVLRGIDDRSLSQVNVVQPLLFTMMVSLAATWRSLGIEPDAVVGHSQGEAAAAYVAGILSLEDAAKLVALRSQALTRLSGKGAMAAVEVPAKELEERLSNFGQRLSIAAINGPHSTVISGEPLALDQLVTELAASNIFARRIHADCAGHCSQVDELQDEFSKALQGLSAHSAQVPFYSSVAGDIIAGETADESYWFRNLRQTVRFDAAVRKLLDADYRFFVEVSPHPVLKLVVQEALETRGVAGVAVGSVQRGDGTLDRMLLSLGELFVHGHSVDWSRIIPNARTISLPTYAFQHQRFWPEALENSTNTSTCKRDREFWDAVERVEVDSLINRLQLTNESERASLTKLLPALADYSRERTASIAEVTRVNPADALMSTDPTRRQARPPLATAYVAPSTEVERILAEAWSQVLGIREVGIHDDFFQLGGNSLIASQILARIKAAFPVQIRFDLFFHNPTIAALARHIDELLLVALGELAEPEVERLLASHDH